MSNFSGPACRRVCMHAYVQCVGLYVPVCVSTAVWHSTPGVSTVHTYVFPTPYVFTLQQSDTTLYTPASILECVHAPSTSCGPSCRTCLADQYTCVHLTPDLHPPTPTSTAHPSWQGGTAQRAGGALKRRTRMRTRKRIAKRRALGFSLRWRAR